MSWRNVSSSSLSRHGGKGWVTPRLELTTDERCNDVLWTDKYYSPVKLLQYSQNIPLIATQIKPVGIYYVESPKSDIKNVRKYFEWDYIYFFVAVRFLWLCGYLWENMDIYKWL